MKKILLLLLLSLPFGSGTAHAESGFRFNVSSIDATGDMYAEQDIFIQGRSVAQTENALIISTGEIKISLTQESLDRANADNAIGVATGTLVRRAGDTITGPLVVNSSMTAIKFIGDGSGLTGLGTSGALNFLFTSTASDIGGGYTDMVLTPNYIPEGRSTLTVSGFPVGIDVVIASRASVLNSPSLTNMPTGRILFHVHCWQSGGSGTAVIYAKEYKRSVSGVETLIATSDISSALTLYESEVQISAVLTQPISMELTDRLVHKVVVVSQSGAPEVSIVIGGIGNNATWAGVSFPAPTIDIANFIPYTGATQTLDLGVHSLTTTGNVYSTNIGALSVATTSLNNTQNAVILSTGVLRTDLTQESLARTNADLAIGLTTGSLRTDLTSEANSRIAGDNALGVSTGTLKTAIDGIYVSTAGLVLRAGDTMTGTLKINPANPLDSLFVGTTTHAADENYYTAWFNGGVGIISTQATNSTIPVFAVHNIAGDDVFTIRSDGSVTMSTASIMGEAVFYAGGIAPENMKVQISSTGLAMISTHTFLTLGDNYVIRDRGDIIATSSLTYLPDTYNTTATSGGSCVTGSTLTFTTNGASVLDMRATGSWSSSGNDTAQATFLIDGQYAGISNATVGIVTQYLTTARPEVMALFNVTPILSKGTHTACLMMWTSGHILSIDSGHRIQFGVFERYIK